MMTVSIVSSPMAAAAPEGASVMLPSRATCGIITCTAYWDVGRTKELQAEWKDTIIGSGGVAEGALALAKKTRAIATSPPGIAVALGLAAQGLIFNHMVNGAANDGRCLTFKFAKVGPNGLPSPLTFGSVGKNNKNCHD
jgi:hypothetical protein